MELLFYIIIAVVIIVKLLFWTIYLCIRRRRQRRQREGTRAAIETCYEEIPAVPQPAYTFCGLSPEDLRQALIIETLPGYHNDEDRYKTDHPPPAYEQNFHSTTESPEEGPSRSVTIDEMVQDIETSDVTMLLQNDDDDDYTCLQQIT